MSWFNDHIRCVIYEEIETYIIDAKTVLDNLCEILASSGFHWFSWFWSNFNWNMFTHAYRICWVDKIGIGTGSYNRLKVGYMHVTLDWFSGFLIILFFNFWIHYSMKMSSVNCVGKLSSRGLIWYMFHIIWIRIEKVMKLPIIRFSRCTMCSHWLVGMKCFVTGF